MNATNAWYIRSQSDEGIKGPFPAGQISQEMLLGRYKLEDQVSHDKEEWFAISTIPELIPDIFTEDRDAPEFNNRLEAARRWADERRGVDKIDDERRENESYESAEIKRLHRLAAGSKKPTNPMATFIQLGIAFIVIISIVVLAFQYSPTEKGVVDCSASAKQGVNLNGCNLSGSKLENAELMAANLMNANLQTANLKWANLTLANLKFAQLHLSNLKYANFTKADLTGANFMGADLSEANLSQANLSYANFRDANILTTDFSNARLDHAIWVDGRKCKPQSVSTCK